MSKPVHSKEKKLVAVVDDEVDILELVALHLGKAFFSVAKFTTADSFLQSLDASLPELIILDLMLPDADGMEICRTLKSDPRYSTIPIIMLTAKGAETDKVLGLELGADDYVTKPFSPKELVARVKSVLRRTRSPDPDRVVNIGGMVTVDPQKYCVRVEKNDIKLTATEFRIMELLSRRPGYVYSRERILDHLWGTEKIVIDRAVDVHIRNLREKMGKAGKFIKSVRGVGYKIEV